MPYPASKMIVVRTSRDTLSLLVAASAMTFALAHAVHKRNDQATATPTTTAAQPAVAQVQQGWAGNLAKVEPAAEPAPSEPMSSAALVVPRSQLALPSMSMRSLVKLRGCQDVPCAKANPPATAPMPARRPIIAAAATAETSTAPRRPLLARLNPLNHLPDMSVIGRPFAYAGGAVSDWIKRF